MSVLQAFLCGFCTLSRLGTYPLLAYGPFNGHWSAAYRQVLSSVIL